MSQEQEEVVDQSLHRAVVNILNGLGVPNFTVQRRVAGLLYTTSIERDGSIEVRCKQRTDPADRFSYKVVAPPDAWSSALTELGSVRQGQTPNGSPCLFVSLRPALTSHAVTVQERAEDCGAQFVDVACTCGYSGTETAGRGCWQEGHNVPAQVEEGHWALALPLLNVPSSPAPAG